MSAVTRSSRLARFGLALARHPAAIRRLQWGVVVIYLFLLIVPTLMPIPDADAHLWSNLRLFAQFVFWGLWWPGVMLLTLFTGRSWCGLFCPEGTLTEWASRHGLGRPIPRWMRWGGWPLFAFVATTLYGQLISVYEYPDAALLILGASSIAALGIGYVYGRGKRLWCRYLCPASGVFAILSRLAPAHYHTDREAWNAARKRSPIPIRAVDCPTLLDIPRLTSSADCLACGRCAGHRDAVQLTARLPNAELGDTVAPVSREQTLVLLFGILGFATAAFQWTVSPWFVRLKLMLAEWLVERNFFLLLQDNAPWWLLTHHPEANDVFTWLDGLILCVYILGGGALLGAVLLLCVWLAARLLQDARIGWERLGMVLAPLGGISLLLGLSMLTLAHLKAERVPLGGVGALRAGLLALAICWSLRLLQLLLRQSGAHNGRRFGSAALMCLPLALMTIIWHKVLFVW